MKAKAKCVCRMTWLINEPKPISQNKLEAISMCPCGKVAKLTKCKSKKGKK